MTLRTHHVVMLFLLVLVLAGNNFLTSSGRGQEEGAVPWSADSLLQPLVEALNLRYAFPTPLGVEVKSWVFGAGTATAMIVAAIGWYLTCVQQRRRRAKASTDHTDPVGATATCEAPGEPRPSGGYAGKRLPANMSALAGAQFMLAILVVYSFVSANWSVTWDISLGGSVVLGAQFAWAIALGRGMNPRAARIGARILLVITVLTAGLAIWYFYERNPAFRAKYPIGNPLFLAAVLLPAILLCGCGLGGRLQAWTRHHSPASLWFGLLAGLVALTVLLWCFLLTGARPPADATLALRFKTLLLAGSRAALIGLSVGLLTIPFMLLGKRTKITLAVTTALIVVAIATVMVPRWQDVSQFGRGATVRLRLYAWSYALQMVKQRSFTGIGQGGYSLLADGPDFAGRDALSDPLAMQGRLAHAHNEWIETWADLGTIGLAFLLAGYLLTFLAGASTIKRLADPQDRWVLAGLLAALVALGVEEFASVGLRVPGLPAVYYTVLGLTWAMCRRDDLQGAPEAWRPAAIMGKLVLLGVTILALLAASLYYRDWAGVRAQFEADRAFEQSHYRQATEAAEFAASARLEPHRKLEARVHLAGTYALVAGAHMERAQQRFARIQAGEIDPQVAKPLIDEDCTLAADPLAKGLELTEELRRGFAGGYTDLGMIEADLCALLAERAAYQDQSRADTMDQLRGRAALALRTELRRNRFCEALVLRYLRLAVGIPVAEQIEMLCGPLRGGTSSSNLYLAAEQLARQQPFASTMKFLLDQAEQDLHSQDPLKWKYLFAPETCRLAAALESRAQHYDSAILLLEKATQLYGQGRNAELLSLCRAQTLQEQGWFAFLGDLLNPDRARILTEAAVETVPPIGKAELFRQAMYAQLVTLAVAARNEPAARTWAERINPHLDEETFAAMLGNNYVVVAELFMRRDLPETDDFLERARHLIPNSPRVLWAEARWAFRQTDDSRVVDLLGQLIDLDDPRRVTAFLQAALAMRPDAARLGEFYEQMVAEQRIPPMPTTTAPATGPATEPPASFDSPPAP